jgi:hypothetical protein
MKKIRVRKGRNPRYAEALNIASENNKLLKENANENFNNVVDLADIKSDLKRLSGKVVERNENLTDAYIKLSSRYWDMINRLQSREARLDLVTTQLKNYVPDHWLFESESDEEDNTKEEPDPKQMEFDFGSKLETKH